MFTPVAEAQEATSDLREREIHRQIQNLREVAAELGNEQVLKWVQSPPPAPSVMRREYPFLTCLTAVLDSPSETFIFWQEALALRYRGRFMRLQTRRGSYGKTGDSEHEKMGLEDGVECCPGLAWVTLNLEAAPNEREPEITLPTLAIQRYGPGKCPHAAVLAAAFHYPDWIFGDGARNGRRSTVLAGLLVTSDGANGYGDFTVVITQYDDIVCLVRDHRAHRLHEGAIRTFFPVVIERHRVPAVPA